MNYAALTSEELARMASTDKGAQQYVAENAEKLVLQAMFESNDSDEAYDSGWAAFRESLLDSYGKELVEQIDKYDDDPKNNDLTRLLNGLLDEFKGVL